MANLIKSGIFKERFASPALDSFLSLVGTSSRDPFDGARRGAARRPRSRFDGRGAAPPAVPRTPRGCEIWLLVSFCWDRRTAKGDRWRGIPLKDLHAVAAQLVSHFFFRYFLDWRKTPGSTDGCMIHFQVICQNLRTGPTPCTALAAQRWKLVGRRLA